MTQLTAKRHGILLAKSDRVFESVGVFNPACIKKGNNVHLFYRAVRKGNRSTIGYCRLDGPLKIEERHIKPFIIPEFDYESRGMEDPRIVQIDDKYYMTYTAYDSVNALGALAISPNLKQFEKCGIITPQFTYKEFNFLAECCEEDGKMPLTQKYFFHFRIFREHGLTSRGEKLLVWDKNVLFFPEKINGKYAMLHRIHPGIQIAFFKNWTELTRQFWENYIMDLNKYIVMDPRLSHESNHIGGGAPPIRTEQGWILIYHSVEATPTGLVYHACAALLDLEDPSKIISRLPSPLLSPEEPYEKYGYVNNVIFPSGTALFDDELYIYYGAADERIAVASIPFSDLLNELLENKTR